jgi:hypothetical protein
VNRRFVSLALLVTLLAGGCVEQFSAVKLGVPVTMAAPADEPPQGDHFKVHSTSLHMLFGLVTISQASLQKSLANQLVGGKSVADVRIKVRSRWSDILITGLTLGLFVPRTVEFEGVIVGTPPLQPGGNP